MLITEVDSLQRGGLLYGDRQRRGAHIRDLVAVESDDL